MRSKGYFMDKVTKEYDYFPLPDGNADVFIYNLSSEKEVQQGTGEEAYTQYEYDMNEFQENAATVTEEMVKENPMKYLDYEPEKPKSIPEQIDDLKEENEMLRECLLEMSELVYQ